MAFRFSQAGMAALKMAAHLARVHGARLHVFHALDYRLLHPQTPDERVVQMTREAEERFCRECRPLLEGMQCLGCHKERDKGPVGCTESHAKNVPDHSTLVKIPANPQP